VHSSSWQSAVHGTWEGGDVTWHTVCEVAELNPGEVRIVTIGRTSVGVFNVAGKFYALHNRCSHRGAPICLGTVGGTAIASAPGEYRYGMDDLVLKCPWHRWEFDIRTGRALRDPDTQRVKTYPVQAEDGMLMVKLS
jgi:3-phenylpropionate/trans-cinnamate dioxygenase ferredoxin subunit